VLLSAPTLTSLTQTIKWSKVSNTMVSKKGGLKRAERRQPELLAVHAKPSVGQEEADKPTFNPYVHEHTVSSSKSKATKKRGQSSKSLARAKLEKGVELADRLAAKANKRVIQSEKKKRVKESA
jgi:hypothetical protein